MAVNFAGGGTGKRLTTPLPFTDLSNITVLFWFKFNASPAARSDLICYGYDDGVASGDGFEVGTAGAGTLVQISLGGVALGINTGFTANVGKTYCYAVTRTGGTWTTYVDGKFQDTASNTPVTPALGTPDFFIGSPTGNIPACDATIGSVGIWKYALTAAQIHDIFLRGKLQGAELHMASRYFLLDDESYEDRANSGYKLVQTGSVTWAPDIVQIQKTDLGVLEFSDLLPIQIPAIVPTKAVTAFDLPQKETKSYGIFFLPPPPPPLPLPNSLKTKITAHDPVQKQTTSHGVYITPAQLAPPNRLITKIAAHDPVQKTTTPFSKFFQPPALKPPSVKKVVAHDPIQKFVRETRFTTLTTLGKLEFHAILADSQRRFSFTAGDMPGSGTFVPGTGRFTLTEGRRRYSVNVGGTL